MRIYDNADAKLKEHLHTSTIVRTPKKLIMKPNTVTVFDGKVYNNFPVFEKDRGKSKQFRKKCVIEDQGLYLKRLGLCSS